MEGCCTDQGTADSHKDSCRNAFATDIGNSETDVLVIDFEEIIEITAYILGCGHGGSNLHLIGQFRERREDTRQNSLLNLMGYSQVAFE